MNGILHIFTHKTYTYYNSELLFEQLYLHDNRVIILVIINLGTTTTNTINIVSDNDDGVF